MKNRIFTVSERWELRCHSFWWIRQEKPHTRVQRLVESALCYLNSSHVLAFRNQPPHTPSRELDCEPNWSSIHSWRKSCTMFSLLSIYLHIFGYSCATLIRIDIRSVRNESARFKMETKIFFFFFEWYWHVAKQLRTKLFVASRIYLIPYWI